MAQSLLDSQPDWSSVFQLIIGDLVTVQRDVKGLLRQMTDAVDLSIETDNMEVVQFALTTARHLMAVSFRSNVNDTALDLLQHYHPTLSSLSLRGCGALSASAI